MKIKFVTFDDIKNFNKLAVHLDGDIFLKSGRYVINGKSIEGIFSLSLDRPVERDIVSKDEREVDSFISELSKLEMNLKRQYLLELLIIIGWNIFLR